jgi:hypothetical protein
MTAKWRHCFHWRIKRPGADSGVSCVRPRRCAGTWAKPLSPAKLALGSIRSWVMRSLRLRWIFVTSQNKVAACFWRGTLFPAGGRKWDRAAASVGGPDRIEGGP